MAESRPRIFQDSRDIFFSLIAIIAVMALSVGFTGMCSFDKDEKEGKPITNVDASSFIGMEARAMNFPVRLPETPQGWVATNARRTTINRAPAPVVGWLTADRGYVQLMQTDQPADAVAKDFDDLDREAADTINAGGLSWVDYPAEENKGDRLWISDLGDVRVVLSGQAAQPDFETMAAAFAAATPLPHQD